jgi:hypothetical protein
MLHESWINDVAIIKHTIGLIFKTSILFCLIRSIYPLKQLILAWGVIGILGGTVGILRALLSNMAPFSIDWSVEVGVELLFILLSAFLVFVAIIKVERVQSA